MHLLLREMQSRGVEIDLYYTGSLRGLGAMRAAIALRGLGRQYDLVHAQYGSVCSWATSWATCAKLVTLRGTDVFGIETGRLAQRVHGTLAKWFTFRALGKYDQIVVMSEQMAGIVAARVSQSVVQVIPDGIDLNRFHPIDRRAARERLGQNDDERPWVLVAGVKSTNPVKRWWLAEAAVVALRQRIGAVEMKAVSGTPHEEMPLWVNASDVVLLTSTHEGWPNVIKEALACNVPFVSTDVSDLRRVAQGTDNCFIVEPDPQILAERLRTAIEFRNGVDLRRLVQEMDVRLVADRYLDVYRRLYSGTTGRAA